MGSFSSTFGIGLTQGALWLLKMNVFFCATSIYVQTILDPWSKPFWNHEVRPVDQDAKQNKTFKALAWSCSLYMIALGSGCVDGSELWLH